MSTSSPRWRHRRGTDFRRRAAQPRAPATGLPPARWSRSTHDQLLGGPRRLKLLGGGSRLDIAYARAISGGREDRCGWLRGRAGPFAIDFVTVRDTSGTWTPYAIEINLRKGTTHPFLTLQFLTDGRYEANTGLFRTPLGREKHLVPPTTSSRRPCVGCRWTTCSTSWPDMAALRPGPAVRRRLPHDELPHRARPDRDDGGRRSPAGRNEPTEQKRCSSTKPGGSRRLPGGRVSVRNLDALCQPRPVASNVVTAQPAIVGSRRACPGESADEAVRRGHSGREIDVEIERGEAFGFLGPNGAGKTSAMRMIGCPRPRARAPGVRHGSGDRGTGDPRAARRRAATGHARRGADRPGELAGVRTVAWPGRRSASALELLEFAQLADQADKVEPLSGGMKRRLTIARALINEPEILLLDEPTTGLDPQARHVLWDRLFRLKRSGVTLVLTTHYMDEAEQLCDRLVVMDNGRVVAAGSPAADREVLDPRSAGAAFPGRRSCAVRARRSPISLRAPRPGAALYRRRRPRRGDRARARTRAAVGACAPLDARGRLPVPDRPDAGRLMTATTITAVGSTPGRSGTAGPGRSPSGWRRTGGSGEARCSRASSHHCSSWRRWASASDCSLTPDRMAAWAA